MARSVVAALAPRQRITSCRIASSRSRGIGCRYREMMWRNFARFVVMGRVMSKGSASSIATARDQLIVVSARRLVGFRVDFLFASNFFPIAMNKAGRIAKGHTARDRRGSYGAEGAGSVSLVAACQRVVDACDQLVNCHDFILVAVEGSARSDG